jgi:hypothetical protein
MQGISARRNLGQTNFAGKLGFDWALVQRVSPKRIHLQPLVTLVLDTRAQTASGK